MSDTKILAKRDHVGTCFATFISIENGVALITLGLHDGSRTQSARKHPLTPGEARDLASELIQRSDLIEYGAGLKAPESPALGQ